MVGGGGGGGGGHEVMNQQETKAVKHEAARIGQNRVWTSTGLMDRQTLANWAALPGRWPKSTTLQHL